MDIAKQEFVVKNTWAIYSLLLTTIATVTAGKVSRSQHAHVMYHVGSHITANNFD